MKAPILLFVLCILLISCGKFKNQLEDEARIKRENEYIRDSIFVANKNLEAMKLQQKNVELQQKRDEKKIELLKKYNANEEWINLDTFTYVKQEFILKYPIGFNGRISDITKLNNQYNIQTIFTEDLLNDLLEENIYIADILATKSQIIELNKRLNSNPKINRGYFIIKVSKTEADKVKDDDKFKNRLKIYGKLMDVYLYEDEINFEEAIENMVDGLLKKTKVKTDEDF